MMKKQRRRMISLMLAVLLALSSFTPYVVYAAGGVAAGSNDNAAGGQQKAADYNMHGWGMMVTLYSMDNEYRNKEQKRDEIGRKYLEDTTSTVINIQTSDTFLKDFPDFWLNSGTASRSALIFNASNDKYSEWTSSKKPTNKFVGLDGTATAIKAKSCYAVKRNQTAPGSLSIKVVADEIKSDGKLL